MCPRGQGRPRGIHLCLVDRAFATTETVDSGSISGNVKAITRNTGA